MSRAGTLITADRPPLSAQRAPRSCGGDGWNALADIEVVVFAVEAELEAMDRERVGVHRRGRKPDLTLRRRLIGLIWTLTFGGMQWRVAGWLSGVPFTTLHSTFARWARLGLWRRLGQRLAGDWRLACDDAVLPSAVVADSRSLRHAALLHKVPYYTTLSGAVAAAQGIKAYLEGDLEVHALQSYYGGRD